METDSFKTHHPVLKSTCFDRLGPLKPKFVVFVIVLLFALMAPIYVTTLWAGELAPEFTLPDLSGKAISLSDFRGKYVIVDFWATWCVPCRKSLPALAQADRKYRDQDVVILGLAIDNPDSFDNAYLAKFLKPFDVEYPILRADNLTITQYLGDEEPAIPTLFVIDRQGRIVEKHEGFVSNELDLMVEELLSNQ